MSSTRPPTVVLNEVSYNGGDTGYRVILSEGADIFGETGEHVAEGVAESEDEIPVCIANLRYKLLGWDGVTSDDLERLWDHRPERISRSARHFAGAVLEDVYSELYTLDSDTAESSAEMHESVTEPCNELHSSDKGCKSELPPPEGTDAEKATESGECKKQLVEESGKSSLHSVKTDSERNPNGTGTCDHLPEYRIDGECLRCDLERQGEQDRAVKRELTADSGGGG